MARLPLAAAPALALVILAAAACAAPAPSPPPPSHTAPPPTPIAGAPTPTPVAGETPDPLAGGPPAGAPPRDRIVRFEDVALSEDGLELTLRFTGGVAFQPDNPCSTAYQGWAEPAGDVLWAAVVDVTPPFQPPMPDGFGCDALGHGRQVTVSLEAPFAGTRVRDVAGDVHFVRRPEGLAAMPSLPDGWELRSGGDVGESPTGRWVRTWSPHEVLPLGTSAGKLDLYQAFGGPVNVTGGDGGGQSVVVNGEPATLYTWPADGELVLVWSIGDTQLALVANAGDFPREALLSLAEGVTLP